MNHPLRSSSLFIAILLCACLSYARAQQKPFPAYTGHVNDFANVLDAQTKQKLETWLDNFEKLTGTQIAAVTVQSLEGRSIEEYANGLYRAWGIGAKSGENKNKGALLLVAIQDRRTRLEVGYGLEGDLPDGLAGEIIRRMRPSLQQGDYSQAMTIGVRTLIDTLAEKWNVNISGINDRRYAYRAPARGGGGGMGLFCMIVGFVIFLMLISALSRRGGGGGGTGAGNRWWLYPIIFNRGGGSFGGGSWGNTGGWGGGGGGGWGGFGGGSSGGGGASDSW
jgi:uncharacterized protein